MCDTPIRLSEDLGPMLFDIDYAPDVSRLPDRLGPE